LTAGLFGVGAAIPAARALRRGRQGAENAAPPPQAAALAPEGLSSPALTRAMLDLPPDPIGPDFNFALSGGQSSAPYAQQLLDAGGVPRLGFFEAESNRSRGLAPAIESFRQGFLRLPDVLSAQDLAALTGRLVGAQGRVGGNTYGQLHFSYFPRPEALQNTARKLGADINSQGLAELLQDAQGNFLQVLPSTVRLNPRALKNPADAINTLGHELGHAVDLFSDVTGNVRQLSGSDLSRFVSEALVDSRWLQAFPSEFAPPASGSMLGTPQAVSPEMFNLVRQRASSPDNLPNRSKWFNYAAAPKELVAQALGNQFTSGREGITQQLLLDALQAPALRGRVQMQ
jgi:hypothetical protein